MNPRPSKPKDPLQELAADFAKKGMNTTTMIRRMYESQHSMPRETPPDVIDKIAKNGALVAQSRAELFDLFETSASKNLHQKKTIIDKNIEFISTNKTTKDFQVPLTDEFQPIRQGIDLTDEERNKYKQEASELIKKQKEVGELTHQLREKKVTPEIVRNKINELNKPQQQLTKETINLVRNEKTLLDKVSNLEQRTTKTISVASSGLSPEMVQRALNQPNR